MNNIYSPDMMRELIVAMHHKGSPMTHLAGHTKQMPSEAMVNFFDQAALVKFLMATLGTLAPFFFKAGGVLLGADFSFFENKAGFGFMPVGGGFNTINNLRLMIWLLFRGCSTESKPCTLKANGTYFMWQKYIPTDLLIELELQNTRDLTEQVIKLFNLQDYVGTKEQNILFNSFLANLLKEERKDKKQVVESIFATIRQIYPEAEIWMDAGDYARGGYTFDIELVDLWGIDSCYVDKKTVRYVLLILSNILGVNATAEGQPRFLEVFPEEEDGSFSVIFDRATKYTVTDDEVLREGQPVQCMLVNNLYKGPQDYKLFNSHGAFLFTLWAVLPYILTQNLGVGTWERRYMQSTLPIDMESMVGAETHGMRLQYNKFVAHQYLYACGANNTVLHVAPFGIDPVIKLPVGGVRFNVGADLKRFKHPSIADHILEKYNLFFSDKSMVYMDGRLLAIRIAHLPSVEEQQRVVRAQLKTISGCVHLKDAIAKIYKLDGLTDELAEEALVIITEELLDIETKKEKKPVPRIQLRHPTASNFLVDGELSAFIEAGQIIDGVKRDVVHVEEVCISETITDTAGLSIRWHPMKPFFVQKNVSDVLEKHDLSGMELGINCGYTQSSHADGTVRYDFTTPGTWVQTNSWGRQMTFSHYGGYEGNKFGLIPLRGEQVKKGHVLLRMPYTLEGSEETFYHEVKAPRDLFIFAFEYFVNGMGGLEYKFYGLYLGVAYKMRNTLKAMPAFSVTGDKYFYNSLNNIPAGVKMLITQDCIKYKDLLKAELNYVAVTAAKNGFGHLLDAVNNAIGFDLDAISELDRKKCFDSSGSYLVYHNLAASLGYYDSLRKWFWDRYGQPVWVYRRDIKDGIWSILNEALKLRGLAPSVKYWVKRNVKELEDLGIVPVGKFPEGSDVYTSNAAGDGTITKYDDIFVFYKDDHAHCPLACWQRGYSATAIVNENGVVEHVYGEHKVEISDFVANCTTAKTMQAVINNIAVENGSTPAHPELAMALMSDYKERVDKYATFMAMADTQPKTLVRDGKPLPVINVFGNDGTLNPEVKAIIDNNPWVLTNYTTNSLTVKDLYKLFKDVMLDISGLRIYVPVLAEQDMKGSNTETSSGLMRSLLSDILKGAKPEDVKGRVARLRALIGSVVGINTYDDDGSQDEGLNIMRGMTQGVESMLAKSVAVAGFPYKTVVPKSNDPTSYYYQAKQLFLANGYEEEDIEGATMWVTRDNDPRMRMQRTPLSSQNERAFCGVAPGDYIYVFNDEGVKQDAYFLMTNYITPVEEEQQGAKPHVHTVHSQSATILEHMGDCDGDGEGGTVVPKEFCLDTPNMNLETCKLSILRATSKEVFALEQDSYTMDQMLPKKISIKRYTNPVTLDKDNLKLLRSKLAVVDGKLVRTEDLHSWLRICVEAGETKAYDVGWAYTFYVYMALLVGICINFAELNGHDTNVLWKASNTQIWDFCNKLGGGLAPYMINPNLFKPITEVYEGGPLSGLNWFSRIYMAYLKNAMMPSGKKINIPSTRDFNDKNPDNMDFATFQNALDEAGINVNYSFEYYYGALSFGSIQSFYEKKVYQQPLDVLLGMELSYSEFAKTAAALDFWVTKGQINFEGKKGFRKLLMCIAYHTCTGIDKEMLAAINVPVRFLNYAIPQILRVAKYPSEDMKMFVLAKVLKEDGLNIPIDANSFDGSRLID